MNTTMVLSAAFAAGGGRHLLLLLRQIHATACLRRIHREEAAETKAADLVAVLKAVDRNR